MTGSVENLQAVLQAIQKLLELGERKMREDKKPTKLFLRLCDMELFLGSHAVDVEMKKALLTTKTTINRWTLLGYVNHATNNDILKLKN